MNDPLALISQALREKETISITPEMLQDHYERLHSPECQHTFKVGDMITWKDGMKFCKLPDYGQPVIVTKVLDKPIKGCEEQEVESVGWALTYDIVIGVFAPDGDYCEYPVDSRRFKPFKDNRQS